MRWTKILALVLLIALAAVACQSARVEKPATDLSATEASEGYPPVDLSAYPEPETSTSMYPDAQDGDEVYWEQAVALILNGEVTQVGQTHDLQVSLTLQDGRTLVTVEPAIDEVLKVIEECGEKCKNIQVATE